MIVLQFLRCIGMLHRSVRASVMEDTPYAVTNEGKLSQLRSLDSVDQLRTSMKAKNGNVLSQHQKHEPKMLKAAPKFAQIAVLKSGCVFVSSYAFAK